MSTSVTSRRQHLSRAQPAVQHQPGDRPVPPGSEAGQQLGRLRLGQRGRQPSRLAQPQRGTVLRPADRVREHPAALPEVRQRASRPFGTGLFRVRVAHRGEREQPRDRRQPTVDRRRRVPVHPTPRQPDHVRPRPPGHAALRDRPAGTPAAPPWSPPPAAASRPPASGRTRAGHSRRRAPSSASSSDRPDTPDTHRPTRTGRHAVPANAQRRHVPRAADPTR